MDDMELSAPVEAAPAVPKLRSAVAGSRGKKIREMKDEDLSMVVHRSWVASSRRAGGENACILDRIDQAISTARAS
jgi:hypothetical protein